MSQTILIVEDSKPISKFLKSRFESRGFECDCAHTLKEAIQKVGSKRFDFITLDLYLPDGEGDELLENISSKADSKIIVLTSATDKDRRDLLFKNGVFDYFNKDTFGESTINQILSSIRQVDENERSNVLIIDDSVVVTKTIKKLLSIRGYNVLVANDGAIGLEVFKNNQIDLAIIDLEMPTMDGLQLLGKIKSDPKFELTPILMLSATADADAIGDSLKNGAVDFIRKPYLPEEMVRKVNFWTEYSRRFRQLNTSNKLLNEYKKVIDKSTIVSKTDPKGIITYVNDKFCDISGYSPSELIGKPHNIIRHPDMPKEAFEDLWNTIQAKYVWNGIVKNRRKDGSSYVVDSTVTPILDENGDIAEYISVRHDVTELEEMKNELQNKLGGTERTLSEMMDIASQYEAVTEELNLIVKTLPNGQIIYANQKFCEVSGYELRELLGESYQNAVRPRTLRGGFGVVQESIDKNGFFKGVVRGRKKDGSPFWSDAISKPIIINGAIVEYVHVSSDITSVISLNLELEETQREILYRISEIGETRNKETGCHVKRVAEYSKLLAQKYGLTDEECRLVYIAAPMHDIGKVAIPDSILLKQGKLTEEEFEIMRTHSAIGAKTLSGSKRKIIETASIIAAQHHEKYDGSGYPARLAGEDIHIFGRIVAIADVFDALNSDRPYKKAWEMDEIKELFIKERGKHFDPKLTDLLLNNIDEFVKIKEIYSESGEEGECFN